MSALLLLWSAPGLAELRSRHFAMHVFALLACAAILGDTAWHIGLTRSVAMAEAKKESANLAESVAEQAAATVSAAEILVDAVADDGGRESLRQNRSSKCSGLWGECPFARLPAR